MTRLPTPEERDYGAVVVPVEDLPDAYLEGNDPGPHGYTATVDDGEVGIHEAVAPVLAARWRDEFDAYDYHVGDGEGDDSDDADADESDGETCQEVLTSGDREGEVCGRNLPCRFHTEG